MCTATTRHVHHDALSVWHEERSDEDHEDVIGDESAQEEGRHTPVGQHHDLQDHGHEEAPQDIEGCPCPRCMAIE
jgi:hypothetical protein